MAFHRRAAEQQVRAVGAGGGEFVGGGECGLGEEGEVVG